MTKNRGAAVSPVFDASAQPCASFPVKESGDAVRPPFLLPFARRLFTVYGQSLIMVCVSGAPSVIGVIATSYLSPSPHPVH